MPELPEVEVVRRGLAAGVVGRTFAAVSLTHPRATRRHAAGGADLAKRLKGRTVVAANRRGKYLWLELDDNRALVAHLGMSGQLLLAPAETAAGAHQRARFEFTDGGRSLRFVDQRTFGGLVLEDLVAGVPASVGHIGLDPLDPAFDVDAAVAALRKKRTQVKRALLDQRLVSGVGNIYADESLWLSRLHYAAPAAGLTRARAKTLLENAAAVMAQALAAGGTSFDRLYVDVEGHQGWFERSLHAYGREGSPCDRCGTPIVREAWTNRSSFRCPRCQRPPRP